MTLLSYGKKQKFIAIKNNKKNSKIHIVLVSNKDKPKSNTLCWFKWFQPNDNIDEIEDKEQLKTILKDKDFCKFCRREFIFLFYSYKEELEIVKKDNV